MTFPIALIAVGLVLWFAFAPAIGAALVLVGCVLLLVGAVR